MSQNHLKFTGRRLTQKDHDSCVRRFGRLYPQFIEPILGATRLYGRGRWHPNPDAPCLYVFRDKDLYEQQERGIFFHIQNTKSEDGIEIVFRLLRGQTPLPADDWASLDADRWQPGKKEWRAFIVRTKTELDTAVRLIQEAVRRYDREFTSF